MESTGAIKASKFLLNSIDLLRQKLDVVRLSDDNVDTAEQFGELGSHLGGG